MRIGQRGVGWIFAGVLGMGSAGCQTIVEPDRTLIKDGGGGGQGGEGQGGEGQGGEGQGGQGGQGGAGGAGGN